MVNLIELPNDTTIETILSEFPSELEREIHLHLYDDETPNLCMITKKQSSSFADPSGDVIIQIVTPYRIVRLVAFIDEKKRELRISRTDKTCSLMLCDFKGLKNWEMPPHYYYLEILT